MSIKSIRGRWLFCLMLLAPLIVGGCKVGGSDSGGRSNDDDTEQTTDSDSDTTTRSASGDDSRKAMWVWGSHSVLDASRQKRLLDFAEMKNVDLLYVGAWSAMETEPETLAEFIRTAQSLGIDVELLFGEREWAFYENHQTVLNIADQVVDFARRYPDAQPTAMHLDVEPYSLDAWEDDKNSVANQMVDLYEQVHARLDGTGLPLVVDIPRWFDKHVIERDGVSSPLHELVIDAVDGVAIMDYQDTYDNIVSDAANELRYASGQQKEVIVGVETLCIDPPAITFCEEGSSFMEEVLDRLDTEMAQEYSAYRGHAVHHFDSYLTLQP